MNKVEIVASVTKLETIGYNLPEGVRITAAPVDDHPGWVTIPLDLGIDPPKIGDTLRVEATWGPINEPFPEDE